MNHEPECEHEARPFLPCICKLLRQAYMRGYLDMCIHMRYLADRSEAEFMQAVNKESM